MNIRVLIAALAGAIATFLSGWLIYGIALKGFFESNTSEAARGIMRSEDTMIMWAIFAGCLAWSLLMAILFSRWASIATFQTGAVAGAWIGALMALGANLFSYASMDVMSLNAVLADTVVNAIQGAFSGGVVGVVLGYKQAK